MFRNPRFGFVFSLLLVAVSLIDFGVDWLRGRPDPVPLLFAGVFAISAYACWRRLRQG